MSTDRYFEKFPTINYSNNLVVDITKRVTFLDSVSRNPYVFYPYDLVSEERADQFSSRYYLDSYKSWIIYLTNGITDPYYGWYLNEREFNEFIEKKYGSIFNARQKIKFYKNDWVSKENISVSAYNALSQDMKKYWVANYSMGSSINDYSRKQIDWTYNTNRVMSYTVANTSFIQDEVVNIYLDGKAFGKGQVVGFSNTEIYVQHVSGYFQESNELVIPTPININVDSTGFTSTHLNVTGANSIVSVNDRIYYNVPANNIPIAPLTGNTYYYVAFVNTSAIVLSETLGGSNIAITDTRFSNTGEIHKIYHGGYIYGTESNVNSMLIDSNSITTNIPDDELNYYKAYSLYDYEEELNEYNRSIKVIEKDYTAQIVDDLNTLLEE